MKNINRIKTICFRLAIFFIVIFALSCYDDPLRENPNDPDNFCYPEYGLYGENLLRESDVSITPGISYSLCLEIKEHYSVKVVMPKSSSSMRWLYYFMPDPIIGWNILEGAIFIADGPGTYDCKVSIENPASGGYGEINFYENGAETPTRVKVLSW